MSMNNVTSSPRRYNTSDDNGAILRSDDNIEYDDAWHYNSWESTMGFISYKSVCRIEVSVTPVAAGSSNVYKHELT